MEEQEQAKGVSWGMGDDAEEFPDMEQVRTLTEHFNPGILLNLDPDPSCYTRLHYKF